MYVPRRRRRPPLLEMMKKRKRPKDTVDNCKKCAKVKVPEMCGYAPKRALEDMSVTMRRRRRMLEDCQILAGIRPAFEKTPLEFRAVIGKAWSDNAKSRPSAAQMACVLSN